jgi:hypothetical protein
MALIIKEILGSDTAETLINKINFNFDQVQLHVVGNIVV